jgi:hypothetical protein
MSQSVSENVFFLFICFFSKILLDFYMFIFMLSYYLWILEMIRECEAEAALHIFEQAFDLTDEEKEAILRQRLAIWTRSNSIDGSLLESWSDFQRLHFPASGLMTVLCITQPNRGVIQSTVVCSKAGPTPSAYVLPASGLTTVL